MSQPGPTKRLRGVQVHKSHSVRLLLPGVLLAAAAFRWPMLTTFLRPEATTPSTTATLMEEVATVTAPAPGEKTFRTRRSRSRAYSGAALEGARGVERADDLARIVPNLIFQENPGAGGSESNAAVFIRVSGNPTSSRPLTRVSASISMAFMIARSVGSLLDLRRHRPRRGFAWAAGNAVRAQHHWWRGQCDHPKANLRLGQRDFQHSLRHR